MDSGDTPRVDSGDAYDPTRSSVSQEPAMSVIDVAELAPIRCLIRSLNSITTLSGEGVSPESTVAWDVRRGLGDGVWTLVTPTPGRR